MPWHPIGAMVMAVNVIQSPEMVWCFDVEHAVEKMWLILGDCVISGECGTSRSQELRTVKNTRETSKAI